VRCRRNLVAVLIYFARILFSGWHEAIFDSPFGPRGTLTVNFWEEICTLSRSSPTTLMNSLTPPSQEWHSGEREPLYSFSSPQRIHGHGPSESPLSKPTDDQHQRIRDGSPGMASLTQMEIKRCYSTQAGQGPLTSPGLDRTRTCSAHSPR